MPHSNARTVVSGTSAGWIATKGYVTNTSGEMHFTFHHRNIYAPEMPEELKTELTFVSVKKVWNDSNHLEKRAEVIARLYENAYKTDKTVL